MFPAVVLTGARQVGKTSLARKVFPEHRYVALDLPALAALAEETPAAFLREYPDPLIIDEVQYAPAIFRHLKAVIDQDRRPGRFILTGSQNFLLMQGVAESLAGRCGVMTMHNLSIREIGDAGLDQRPEALMFKGGFPEVHGRDDMDPGLWYASYLSTYLERDVRNITRVGSLRDFDRFLRACALRIGQLLSFSGLARDVGIAPNTARQWISVLQASGQVYLLEPYHRNLGKRLVKAPKLYLCDTGLAAFLMGLEDQGAIPRHPAAGALWENLMVMETVKHFSATGRVAPLWFWRTAHGAEVDLLIEQGGRFTALEMKFKETPDGADLKGFAALERMYGPSCLTRRAVVCRTETAFPLPGGAEAVPGAGLDRWLEARPARGA